jgi:SAM-dependent methyltransferase
MAWLRRLRGRDDYQRRMSQEIVIFQDCLDVNELPEIFHYWSDRYIRPMLEEVECANPDQFFARFLGAAVADAGPGSTTRLLSVGAGNCDTEVRVARLLRDQGATAFTIECLDINPAMLERGRALARSEGVEEFIRTSLGDFNAWRPQGKYAAVMANQSLHHVLELENLFDAVKDSLLPGGRFVISDMIGRNGHARWPEALAAVQAFWQELPDAYRYNRALKRHEPSYLNWDCSSEGFEGIRAQDILPLLLDHFHTHVFVAFGNVIDVFVDRNFGHNFDAGGDWDRDFIDRVHRFDEDGLAAGMLTPTHMLAVFQREPSAQPHLSRGLRPERCIRRPRPQDPAVER